MVSRVGRGSLRAVLEVVAVAGLVWISWCVFGGADYFVFVFFNFFIAF